MHTRCFKKFSHGINIASGCFCMSEVVSWALTAIDLSTLPAAICWRVTEFRTFLINPFISFISLRAKAKMVNIVKQSEFFLVKVFLFLLKGKKVFLLYFFFLSDFLSFSINNDGIVYSIILTMLQNYLCRKCIYNLLEVCRYFQTLVFREYFLLV